MIHHVAHFQLVGGADPTTLEELVRTSRSQLLKIPEVLAVKSGRNLDPQSPWQFFFAVEVDSREKLRTLLEDPFYLKLLSQSILPHALAHLTLDFELDPSRDLKYS
jgi:hypothetical protein